MDPASFDAAFHNDGSGAPAYAPGLTLKSTLYRYSKAIITGRPIEQARKTNVMVKALARDADPDRDTIARFILSRAPAVKELLPHVLFGRHAPGIWCFLRKD